MQRNSLALLIVWVLAQAALATQPLPIGPEGGDVRSLAVHPQKPDRFFLGTTHGEIYVSEDAGESWARLVPGIPHAHAVVDNLLFHPADPDTLYAACWDLKSNRGWLYRTRDSGESWESISLGRYNSTIRAIAIAPSEPNVLAVGITEGVLLSRDEGVTWERITRGYRSLYNVESLAFDPTDSSTIYVGTWRLGWKTTNGGEKWQAIHKGMHFDSDMFALLVDPRDPTRLYASACTGVYRSQNSGLEWAKLRNGLPNDARRTRTLHLDPSFPDVVYAGSTNGLFVSRDNGQSWQRLLEGVIINAIAARPGREDVILIGIDGGGVLRTLDGGRSFQASNRGFSHRQIAALAVNQGSGAIYASVPASGEAGGFFMDAGSGEDWQPANDGLNVSYSVRKIIPARDGSVYLATSSGIYKGHPGQEDWRLLNATRNLEILDLAVGADSETVFLATNEGVRRLDVQSGRLVPRPIPVYEGPINGLWFEDQKNHLYAATDMGVFRSEDQGESWAIRVKGLPPVSVRWIARSGTRLLCGTESGLYLSDDDSASWRRHPDLGSGDFVAHSVSRRSDLLAVRDASGGIFYSGDAGGSWETPPPVDSRVLSFAVTGNELLLGTLSKGILSIPSSVNSTAGR